MKYIIFLMLIIVFQVKAQAGKMETDGFRLYGGLYSGIIKSTTLEESFNKGANSFGYNIGSQYFLSNNSNNIFSGWVFRIEIDSILKRYSKNGLIQNESFSVAPKRSDLSIGATLKLNNDFRITPRLGYKSISQNLDSQIISINLGIFSKTTTEVSTLNSGGYLGFLFEYDIKPKLTIYLDGIYMDSKYFKTRDSYSYNNIGNFEVNSGNTKDSAASIVSQSGSYNFNYSKVTLGLITELIDKTHIIFQLEGERIESKIIIDNGIIGITGSGSNSPPINQVFYVPLPNNDGKDSVLLSGFRIGFAYDL